MNWIRNLRLNLKIYIYRELVTINREAFEIKPENIKLFFREFG